MGSTQASSGQKAGAVSLGIAGLGVALAGGGFTLRLLSNRRLERLANDYNYGPRVELDFQCTPGGIGLAMRF